MLFRSHFCGGELVASQALAPAKSCCPPAETQGADHNHDGPANAKSGKGKSQKPSKKSCCEEKTHVAKTLEHQPARKYFEVGPDTTTLVPILPLANLFHWPIFNWTSAEEGDDVSWVPATAPPEKDRLYVRYCALKLGDC